jgi:hypothetical protein
VEKQKALEAEQQDMEAEAAKVLVAQQEAKVICFVKNKR